MIPLMTVNEAISFLDNASPDKKTSLPEDLYYFISRTTPLVCVDLLIHDTQGRVLLSWRDDDYYGKGWHIPGGIVRFKETFEQRLQKTAEREIGATVNFDSEPVWIEQLIDTDRENLGHIIAFVYKCRLPEEFILNNLGRKYCNAGYLQWHDDLINIQDYYRKFIGGFQKLEKRK